MSTITSELQLDANIRAELPGPHLGMDMAPSEPQLPAEPVQGDAVPPANTHKIGLTAQFAAYTSTFICMSCFLGCILALIFVSRAVIATLVGFVLLTGYDCFTVGLQASLTTNVGYIIYWQTQALGAGLIGLACGPVLTSCMRCVVFAKCARGELDEASEAERTKLKSKFKSVMKPKCSSSLLDVVLGALMYPVGSLANEWFLSSALEEDLFRVAPVRCIALGILGGVVPLIISTVRKLVGGKKGREVQLPTDDSEKDLEKQEPNVACSSSHIAILPLCLRVDCRTKH